MGHKIKTLVAIADTQKGEIVKAGEIVDFGKDRNELAVNNGWAEWVEAEKKEAEPKKEATVKGKKNRN